MTAIDKRAAGATTGRAVAPPVAPDPCLTRLDVVSRAGRALGIPTDDADAVRTTAGERLGYPSDAYVVAFVGGTGVGKSTLLNALAGSPVSPASVRRPTTARPVAWLPEARRGDLAGLLDWLGVAAEDIHSGPSAPFGEIAVLDVPDLDSTSEDHRRRVEAILPRVDAVVWVTDPEKYADSVLQDEFLRTWLPRLDRQLVVLNKIDRLAADDAERERRDLEGDVARLASGSARRGPATDPPPLVVTTSARAALAGDDGIARLREWIAGQAEAKAIVRARLRATARDAARAMAAAAGVDPATPRRSILDPAARQRALDEATAALLRIVDIEELRRQAVAATRARARGRGAGPLGGLTSLIYRLSGREARVADPAGFLARWRDRGGLGRAVEPIRAAVAEPVRTAPPAVRARLASAFDPPAIEQSLGRAVDRAVVTHDERAPSSPVWPLLGILQTLVTLGLVATVVWVVLWVLVKFPVDSVLLPAIGRAPAPLVALLALLAAGYVLARLLGAHAGWIGRRWARGLAADVRANVARDVGAAAFADLDAVDSDLVRLSEAIVALETECGRG